MHIKNILLGISGSIAAYKVPYIVRLLRKQNYQVEIVVSKHAHHFVAPLALQAVCGKPVHTDTFTPRQSDAMDHIQLARWADVFVIAPASASLIAKIAHGIADDLLATLAITSTCRRYIAPAMNQSMYNNCVVQRNISQLQTDGWEVLQGTPGEQACGEFGEGRMLEPSQIVTAICQPTQNTNEVDAKTCQWWKGRSLLITAGPTHESIDAVRFIGNRSSGKFGYAIAQIAAKLGANVHLVSGPTHLPPPNHVTVTKVSTAAEMLEQSRIHQHCDVIIACAAVADYTPIQTFVNKIHKKNQPLTIALQPTVDIVANLAKNRRQHQIIVGFCAETDQILERAKHKLRTKKLDMVVANVVGKELVFGEDEAAIWLVESNTQREIPHDTKHNQAQHILTAICHLDKKITAKTMFANPIAIAKKR